MKILHTGDWHIGKLVHNLHMTEDQVIILRQLIDYIKEEKPDVMIIAGDVYDRSVPPVEAVELLDRTLNEIIETTNCKVIMISGNHDSSDRLSFANKLLENRGLFIRGKIDEDMTPIILDDGFGPVNFYPLPFVEPAEAKYIFDDMTIRTHDDAMKKMTDRIYERNDPGRRVVIGHCFAMGSDSLEESESERPLTIGGTEYIDVSYFKDFDYVALGHLHKAQRVKYDHVRYSGSLMKYSFSEANHKKSVSLVDLKASGQMFVDFKEFEPIRDMRKIKGQLRDLIDPQVYLSQQREDYIMAIITDQGELLDPIQTLRDVYPNILRLERHIEDIGLESETKVATSEFLKKDPLDLFKDFYEEVSGETFDDEKSKKLVEIVNERSV